MISAHAHLRIEKVPLHRILIDEYEERYLAQLQHYITLLRKNPHMYAGFLSLEPTDAHPGFFYLRDGYTRFCASIMTGRRDVLAVIIEEAHP